MSPPRLTRLFALLASLSVMAGCLGGSGGGEAPVSTVNTAPVARAGADKIVDEQTAVVLDGSGSSDANGDSLNYVWTQTSGASVALNNTTAAQAAFDAPDVGIGSSATLTFQLQVTDSRGGADTDTIDVLVNGVTNSDPTVDAGPDQVVGSTDTVSLRGQADDSDIGDALTFAWRQTSGPSVTIIDGDTLNATFVAPNVGPTGGGESATITVSGKVSYEFVPPRPNCRGLNFDPAFIETRPIRAATVQLIDAGELLAFELAVSDGITTVTDTVSVRITGPVLETTVSDNDGNYAFVNVDGNRDVRLRVRAELKRAGSPSWDVDVRDNVDTSQTPLPLPDRPLYVVQWDIFNTGTTDINDADLTAKTGWGDGSYTGVRAAAPFSILDSIYSGMQLVLAEDPNANFAPLDAFWSINNTRASPQNINAGELPTSFYSGSGNALFLLGDANVDTEEFDDHVILHEWGHYFEDGFSRSDSIGGPHAIGQSIDARLAFGEGWATALAAMALDDPQYCDTGVVGANSGFGINTETNSSGARGWYNEMSVATFLYDLWDTNSDISDTGSIGFGPIFDTMIGPQKHTEAFTTLFSFAAGLRPMLSVPQRDFVDSQLQRENIETSNIDNWATTQGSIDVAPNNARDVLPLYTTLPTDGTTINVCTNADYDQEQDVENRRVRDGNKLAQYRYLRFTTDTPGSYRVTITATTATPVTPDTDDRDQSDPDMMIFRDGQLIAEGTSGVANTESFTTPTLAADTYVAWLQEWRFEDFAGAPDSYPERVCFDVSMNPL